jgi:hypothetical protein
MTKYTTRREIRKEIHGKYLIFHFLVNGQNGMGILKLVSGNQSGAIIYLKSMCRNARKSASGKIQQPIFIVSLSKRFSRAPA